MATLFAPVSSMVEGASASATVGAASSSSIVSVASAGLAILWPPDAAPETVTPLFGESVASAFAVTVTTPALVVAPAAKVSVLSALRVKSPAAAPAPGAADTAIVTAAVDGTASVAVTVERPPFSVIESGVSASVAVAASSSSIVIAPVSAVCPATTASVAFAAPLSFRTMVSSGSFTVSPVTCTPTLAVVSPAAKVSVPAASAV